MRATAERRRDFDEATVLLSHEVLSRCKLEDEARGHEEDIRNLKREIRAAREMFRRQQIEIAELEQATQMANEEKRLRTAERKAAVAQAKARMNQANAERLKKQA